MTHFLTATSKRYGKRASLEVQRRNAFYKHSGFAIPSTLGSAAVKNTVTCAGGDVILKSDENGHEFLEYTERQTKTRTGANPKDNRALKPKLWANIDKPEHSLRPMILGSNETQ